MFLQILKTTAKIGIDDKYYYYDSQKKVVKCSLASQQENNFEIIKDLSTLKLEGCYLVLDDNNLLYTVLLKDKIEVWDKNCQTLYFEENLNSFSITIIPLSIFYFDKGYKFGKKDGSEEKMSEIKTVLNL